MRRIKMFWWKFPFQWACHGLIWYIGNESLSQICNIEFCAVALLFRRRFFYEWLTEFRGVAFESAAAWPGVVDSLSEVSSPHSCLSREGRGDHSTAGQTNSFVNWRRQAGCPRNSAMRKSLGGLQQEIGNPDKVRAVVFCRQIVSWIASCEKGG